MKIKSLKKIVLVIFVLLIVLYLFWGPLFPWNPIKIGFDRIESSKATIFIADFEGENEVYTLDEMIKEEEEFHGLEFKQHFRVLILGKESSMKRYLPWMKGEGFSVKLGSLNLIYIGVNARNSPYGIGVFLKHEISHLLLHQNTPARGDNMEIQKQGWLAEGVATFFGGPHYYERMEFVDLWTDRGLTFDSLYEENPLGMDRTIIRLKYTYYRFFIEYLINTYGEEKFRNYLKSYVANPKGYQELFPEIYGEELDQTLQNFKFYMNS